MRHILLLGLLLAVIAGAGAYQLSYKDTAGTVRWYRTEIALTGNFAVKGTSETLPLTGAITFVRQEKVVAVSDNGVSTIFTRITDGELHMAVGEEETTQSLVDYTATFYRTPSGKITGTRFASDSLDEKVELQPLGFGSQWRLISGIGQELEFPPKDIKAGAKWSQSSTMAEVKTSISNILRGPRDADCLSIESRTKIKIPGITLNIPMEDETIAVKQAAEMTAESSALFDAEKGELAGADFTGELKITVTLPGSGKPVNIIGLMKLTGATDRISEPVEPEKITDPAAGEEPGKEK